MNTQLYHLRNGLIVKYVEVVHDDWRQFALKPDGTWHPYEGYDVLPLDTLLVVEPTPVEA